MSGDGAQQQQREEAEVEPYFQEYGLPVHEVMLKDVPRTEGYLAALKACGSLEGKVVLDVGAGTGILSLFAARLGARKVYAVEASPFAGMTRRLVEHNGFGHVVEVIHAKVEDVELPEKADILVSEWMGHYLLHEGMLQSVLSARDRLLKPDGLMLPRHAELFVCPVELAEVRAERLDFWRNVYGFDFSPVLPHALDTAAQECLVRVVPGRELLAEPQSLARYDLRTVRDEDLKIVYGDHRFELPRPGAVGGFCLWFDVAFETWNTAAEPVVLTTSPAAPPTHWKQTSVLLPSPVSVVAGAAVRCAVTMSADPADERKYEISVDLLPPDGDDEDDDADITFGEHPRSCDCLQCVLVRSTTKEYNRRDRERAAAAAADSAGDPASA